MNPQYGSCSRLEGVSSVEKPILELANLMRNLPVPPLLPLFSDGSHPSGADTVPGAAPLFPNAVPPGDGQPSREITDVYEHSEPEPAPSPEFTSQPSLPERPAGSFLHPLTHQPIPVQAQAVRSGELILRLKELLLPALDAKSVRLVITERGDSIPFLHLDSGHTQQILARLLSLTANLSERGGEIRLITDRERRDDGVVWLRFVLKAPSCNLPENAVAALSSGTLPAPSITSENLALNLGLCKNIAMLLGGSLLIRNEKGEGTLFLLEVPARTEAAARDSSGAKTGRFSGKRILLAEAGPNGSEDANILQKREIMVDFVQNDQDAVRRFRCSTPGYYAAILTDMPPLASEIRCLDRRDAPLIPILGLLSQDSGENLDRAFRCGVDFCLVCPYSPQQLFLALDSFLL